MFNKAFSEGAFFLCMALAALFGAGGGLCTLGGFIMALAHENPYELWMSAAGILSIGLCGFFGTLATNMNRRPTPPADPYFNGPRFRFDNPN